MTLPTPRARCSFAAAFALAATLALPGCCTSGPNASPAEVATLGPDTLLVVYYPDHATWNTNLMSIAVSLDGVELPRLCEGSFLAVEVTPGSHVLTTELDEECAMARGPREPVVLDVAPGAVQWVRYGSVTYTAASSESNCFRRLVPVDAATARREGPELTLVHTSWDVDPADETAGG